MLEPGDMVKNVAKSPPRLAAALLRREMVIRIDIPVRSHYYTHVPFDCQKLPRIPDDYRRICIAFIGE